MSYTLILHLPDGACRYKDGILDGAASPCEIALWLELERLRSAPAALTKEQVECLQKIEAFLDDRCDLHTTVSSLKFNAKMSLLAAFPAAFASEPPTKKIK